MVAKVQTRIDVSYRCQSGCPTHGVGHVVDIHLVFAVYHFAACSARFKPGGDCGNGSMLVACVRNVHSVYTILLHIGYKFIYHVYA